MTTAVKPDTREHQLSQTLSPRDRIKQGRPLKHKDVQVEGLGRFRVRQLRQRELEDMVAPLTKVEGEEKGDNRGWKARVIAYALINDDGSQVYPVIEEGVQDIGGLTRDAVDALFDGVDELNALTKGAKDELGKGSGTTPGAAG